MAAPGFNFVPLRLMVPPQADQVITDVKERQDGDT